jgi:tripartite-type tricarboxylate transporter receptor subunit TctC
VKGGRLRALAQTGKSRISALPEVPTAIESGFAGFEAYAWWGVFTAAGTPQPIIERFGAALAETLREPAINKQISENLQIAMLLAGPEEERRFLSEQMKLWGPVVREHGIKGD